MRDEIWQEAGACEFLDATCCYLPASFLEFVFIWRDEYRNTEPIAPCPVRCGLSASSTKETKKRYPYLDRTIQEAEAIWLMATSTNRRRLSFGNGRSPLISD